MVNEADETTRIRSIYMTDFTVPIHRVLSPAAMRQDLNSLVQRLIAHPARKHETTEFTAALDTICCHISHPMPLWQFHRHLETLVALYHDCHTTVHEPPGRFLPLWVLWLTDGLFVRFDDDQLKASDRLLSLGHLSEYELRRRIAEYPYENGYDMRASAPGKMTCETFLLQQGLADGDSVSVTIERDGETLRIDLPLLPEFCGPYPNHTYMEWEFDEQCSLGMLSLALFRQDETWQEQVEQFFVEAVERKVENVAINLLGNRGGEIGALVKLLSHLPVNSAWGFAAYDDKDFGVSVTPESFLEDTHLCDISPYMAERLYAFLVEYGFVENGHSVSKSMWRLNRLIRELHLELKLSCDVNQFAGYVEEKLTRTMTVNGYSGHETLNNYEANDLDWLEKIAGMEWCGRLLQELETEGIVLKGGYVATRAMNNSQMIRNAGKRFYELLPRSMRNAVADSEAEFSVRLLRTLRSVHERLTEQKVFCGDLYVLTSHRSFSCSVLLASLLQDNRLATVIGEPPGNDANFYGAAREYQLPESELRFAVSSKAVYRPNADTGGNQLLIPDVEVYYSRRSLKDRSNPIVDTLREMVSGGGLLICSGFWS